MSRPLPDRRLLDARIAWLRIRHGDVARAIGVSKATFSRILRFQPHLVEPDMVEAIMGVLDMNGGDDPGAMITADHPAFSEVPKTAGPEERADALVAWFVGPGLCG